MNKPTVQVKLIAHSFQGQGINLNWCEKTKCWAIFRYDYSTGNKKIASILVDRKRK